MNELWVWIMQAAIILTTITAGGGAVWIINRIKGWLNIDGSWALVLTAAVSLLMATAALVVDGTISPDGLTPENLGTLFIIVFVSSQAIYRSLKS
jgi:hypothetical protein